MLNVRRERPSIIGTIIGCFFTLGIAGIGLAAQSWLLIVIGIVLTVVWIASRTGSEHVDSVRVEVVNHEQISSARPTFQAEQPAARVVPTMATSTHVCDICKNDASVVTAEVIGPSRLFICKHCKDALRAKQSAEAVERFMQSKR